MHTYSALIRDEQQLTRFLGSLSDDASQSVLIQLLSSQDERQIRSYAQLIEERLPEAKIIGHSTRHVIHQGDIHHHSTLIAVSVFCCTQLSAAHVPLQGHPDNEAASLTEQLELNEQSKLIISFSQLTNGRDYNLYLALNPIADVPVCGGLAASVDGQPAWLLLGTDIHHDSSIAVALHGESLSVWRSAFAEWNPIGSPLRVTAVSGNKLISLNHEPAYDVFRQRLADGKALTLEQMLSFPLQRDNRQQICVPSELHPGGVVELDNPLEVGDEVRICYNHPSVTLEQVRHNTAQLAQYNPEAVFIYNCESRLEFIEGTSEIKPFDRFESCIGSYCMGELYRNEQQEVLHHSMTYVALSENDRQPLQHQLQEEYPISPLFHLIRHSIEELDETRKQIEEKLARQTEKLIESYRYDKHTGLKNRAALQEEVRGADANTHLITLKLSNFHQVNEKYGYQVADELIRDLTDLFVVQLETHRGEAALRQLYYIGIAEWALVFSSQESSERIRQEFLLFADKIEHINFEPYGLPEVDYLSVSVTGGLASMKDFPDIEGEELLLRAIDARRKGKAHNTHLYNAKDCATGIEAQQERLALMGSVSRAILNQRILTFSQPIFAAQSHEMVSQECLVRIEDEGEIIAPGRFLPIIEDTHLYTRLNRFMLSSTLAYMADKAMPFSINLSPQDMLSDKTLYLLEESIARLNDPSRLGLEVLESEQIKDFSRMTEICGHFKAMGVRLLVDDFGSGYSNIDQIIRLEPDIIKLDGSLIKTIDTDPKQRQITGQLVKLCQVLNAKTVAEFVHNQAVCEIAEDLGVDYLQGFYLGEPTRLF
ncbi:EAL domain-containing protein [Vibrio sp. St2]|uniref:bifunctional diguanylate cyclase/phosphodiesterase n=1 Tax=Vibrio sp. St2 TaxID=2853441 RepID=UPI00248E8749|nr:EAL domain-containing protein [Vibrio sp. St2]